MRSITQSLKFARSIDANTSPDAIRTALSEVVGRQDQASHARAVIVERTCAATTPGQTATMLGVGASAVSNVRKAIRVWNVTGFSDAYVTMAWTDVTSSARWLNRWSTPEGVALLEHIAAATGDEAKYAILTGTSVPETVKADPTVKDVLAALARADVLSESLTFTDDDRAVIADLLASIGAHAKGRTLTGAALNY